MTEGLLAGGYLLGLPLPTLWFALLFATLAAFLFLDGFDFGAGVVFAALADREDREAVVAAIGPFWDGNEVWFVVFGGTLFAVFPAAYAGVLGRQYLLVFALLAALGARGLAPELYEQRDDERWRRWWGRSFAVGSAGTPLVLGLVLGNWLVGAGTVSVAGLVLGPALVALSVVAGAAFLALKTHLDRDRLQRYGGTALGAYVALAAALLAVLHLRTPPAAPAPGVAPTVGLLGGTLAGAGGYRVAMARDRPLAALAASAGLVAVLVGGLAAVMYPQVDPAVGLTVEAAVVSTLPLNLMSVGAVVLLPLVVGYFAVLYSAFGGPIGAEEAY